MTAIEATAQIDPRLPVRLNADWSQVTRPTEPAEPFDPAMVEHLPGPARRWLRHAIAPGTPLRRSVVLHQHGTIRLGSWRPFTASEALAPLEGFLWPVTTHLFGLPIHGFDRYSHGTGEMRHRVLGLLTVMTATGPDIDRSAAARHTSEIIWAPAAALAPQIGWRSEDDTRVTVLIPCGPWVFEPTLTVALSGAVQQVTLPRWTNVGRTVWHEEPFTAMLQAERTFGGYTIPTKTTAGWAHGTRGWDNGGAFIHQIIDAATYL
jgi:hypothetical protein